MLMTQVWTESTKDRVTSRIEVSVRFHHWRREAHGNPISDTNDHSRTMRWLTPSLTNPIHVPRAGHPHVRVHHDTVVPHDLQMFAVAPNFLDGLPNPRGDTGQTRSLESHHLLADQRNS